MPWRESFDPSCRLGTAGWTSSCSKSRLFWPVCYGQPAYYRLYSWHVSWIQTGSYDKLITRYILTRWNEIFEKLWRNHFEGDILNLSLNLAKFEWEGNCSHSILLSILFTILYPCKKWELTLFSLILPEIEEKSIKQPYTFVCIHTYYLHQCLRLVPSGNFFCGLIQKSLLKKVRAIVLLKIDTHIVPISRFHKSESLLKKFVPDQRLSPFYQNMV